MSINYVAISDNLPGDGCSLDDWNTSYAGCSCQERPVDDSSDPTRTCSMATTRCECIFDGRQIYDEQGRLDLNELAANATTILLPINECHFECKCDEETCMNRVVQKGCKYDLEAFDCEPAVKGKGLRTREPIQAGSFVIEYMGEVIGPSRARELLKERSAEPNYILFLREHFTNDQSVLTTVIDARNYSNLARFINHSCEPNLMVIPVRTDNVVPHAALFAKRDILELEELTYDYNGTLNRLFDQPVPHAEASERNCFCDAPNCRGFLPRGDI